MDILVTEETSVDLGSCIRREKPNVPCLWPVTDVFQFTKKNYAVEQSYLVRVKQYGYFLECSMWLEACINLTLG